MSKNTGCYKKQVDLPNYWDNHKLCKWVGKSYKKLYYTEIITKACLLRCKITHTHTDYSHHWYIRTRLQCGHIFMTRYAKSHTHRSCSQVVDLAARGHQTSSISADGLETWFLSWLIKESFCLSTLILVCKTKAFLNYAHLTRKNNDISSNQILVASSSYKWT
jgi:hypothetical protein